MDGTMQRERASVLPLIVFPSRQFLQPQERHDERFSISSNRVRPPSGGATRNEDWPGSPTVKQTRARRKTEMKKITLCAIIGTSLGVVHALAGLILNLVQQSIITTGGENVGEKLQSLQPYALALPFVSIASFALILIFFVSLYNKQ